MRRCLLALAFLAALAGAQAQDSKPAKAPSPGEGVILLKEAWEAGDLDAVVARYAEPGASYVRSDLAALKRVEEAQSALAAAVGEKLGEAAALELVPQDRRTGSPLQGANVTMLASRIKGERAATTKFRVANREGERFFRFTHVLQDGDWKIVLSSLDGQVLDEKGLKRLAARTAAHQRAADEMREVARDVRSGALASRDQIRKRLVELLDREKRAVEDDGRGERRDELHEND